MIKPKECYNLSKTGWDYVTKISIDPLTCCAITEQEAVCYGKFAHFQKYIGKHDKLLGIILDGDAYISKDQYAIYYKTFKNIPKKFSAHLLSSKKYYYSILKSAKKMAKIKIFSK